MKRKWKGIGGPALSLISLLAIASAILAAGDRKQISVNEDVLGLMSFKESSISSDPNGVLSNWSPNSSTPCSFTGVTCSTAGRVTAIDLTGAALSGNLHLDKITSIPFLTDLRLARNQFSGNLSAASPSSCRLKTLDLSSNNFSDPLAASKSLLSCTNFISLNLSDNLIPSGTINVAPSLTHLDLSKNRISDSSLLSLSLSNSQTLTLLNFSHNRMNGNLGFLSNLPQSLKTLDISRNNFSQNLSNLQFKSCQNLSVLNLSHNALLGSVLSSTLSECSMLEELDLGYNGLEFEIPGNFLKNLNNLRRLNLAGNRLFGEIPEELGKSCEKLEELDLSGNSLIGGLPLSFSGCSSMLSLNLGNNQLSGDFLDTVVVSLSSLRYLYLPFNNLTGNVPISLSNNSRLIELDLSSNEFTGKIPSGFCSSSSSSGALERLLLANNYFLGSVPPELGKCENLREIDLSFNNLSGEIPPEIWKLPMISELVMWANNLTGEIPEGICTDGGNLQTLILNNNLISGNLPQSISNCTNLIWVSLSSNRINGTIPSGIGNLVNLAILQLGNNSLTGEIPRTLGDCRSLIWLDLNSNSLAGTIPYEISKNAGFVESGTVSGKQFAFVRNEGGTACRGAGGLVEFKGIRPSRLENFPMVHSCPSTRIYTGVTVYTFINNGSMIYLDLSYNSLSGTIPGNLGSMNYLQVLNLGHNDLKGNIPSSFGGLKVVGVLDLSHNSLQGFIPPSLGGLTFLSDLDVSNNNLTGPIPLGGQLTTFPSSRYENNTGLCGVPLPPCGLKTGPHHGPSSNTQVGKKEALTAEMVIGIGLCLFFIFMLLLALNKIKKQKKDGERNRYMESLPTSGSSSWKLSGVAEPLSINVAAFEKPLRKLTFAHLLEATNGFSSESLIGCGGFGEVYRAQLRDGSIVAIKKLIHVTSQGDREFMAEMETIGKIKHRNLVPLLGYCRIGEERLLVYEYMKWGCLDSVLHENQGRRLDWAVRKRIAIGSARGLAFLHHSCVPHIIHRDMKSSNILLDESFEARLSDFGMARLVNAFDTHLSVSTLAGTPGYVPPEYYQSFRCTAKGDVYSYGVILLELLSGKRPIDPLEFGDDNNLVGWAKQLHKEKRVDEIFDPELVSDESTDGAELNQCLKIVFECLDDRPLRRPTMIQVLSKFRCLQTDSESEVLDDVVLMPSTVLEEQQEKET